MNIEIKRGEQLVLDVTRTDAAGLPVSLTGMTITSSVAITGFSQALGVAVTNAAAGQFRLSAPAAQTQAWPVAALSCDVKYDAGGGAIRRSKTFKIKVAQEITP